MLPNSPVRGREEQGPEAGPGLGKDGEWETTAEWDQLHGTECDGNYTWNLKPQCLGSHPILCSLVIPQRKVTHLSASPFPHP